VAVAGTPHARAGSPENGLHGFGVPRPQQELREGSGLDTRRGAVRSSASAGSL